MDLRKEVGLRVYRPLLLDAASGKTFQFISKGGPLSPCEARLLLVRLTLIIRHIVEERAVRINLGLSLTDLGFRQLICQIRDPHVSRIVHLLVLFFQRIVLLL